jgi:hypothetical protein
MLHGAYSFALAFEADLVAGILDRLGLADDSVVADPFCGTGTTILESKVRGFRSVGIDANPICVMVSRAKTEWALDRTLTQQLATTIISGAKREYRSFIRRYARATERGKRWHPDMDLIFQRSGPGRYLIESGLIKRGWISARPALKTLLLAEKIWNLPSRPRNFLMLCLLGKLVPDISNMAYGPEIYRARRRADCDVFGLFNKNLTANLGKLELLAMNGRGARTSIRRGDATNSGLSFLESNSIDAIITSPPYLSDHDYSRLTRLELVYGGFVTSAQQLRAAKQMLMRSSSKNVYKDDNAVDLVRGFASVTEAIREISDKAASRDSGFARVYPRLVGEYFGGMYKHFCQLKRVLRRGARAAYVVGDQSSFFATPIPSARIVAELADDCGRGLMIESIVPIREYRGTRGRVTWKNREWLIIMRKR